MNIAIGKCAALLLMCLLPLQRWSPRVVGTTAMTIGQPTTEGAGAFLLASAWLLVALGVAMGFACSIILAVRSRQGAKGKGEKVSAQ